MTRRLTDHSSDSSRPTLDLSSEFRRFLGNKRADSVRDNDLLQSEIETLEAQIQGKRDEQAELADIIARCDAGLTIDVKANRTAPQLKPHTEVAQALGQEQQE